MATCFVTQALVLEINFDTIHRRRVAVRAISYPFAAVAYLTSNSVFGCVLGNSGISFLSLDQASYVHLDYFLTRLRQRSVCMSSAKIFWSGGQVSRIWSAQLWVYVFRPHARSHSVLEKSTSTTRNSSSNVFHPDTCLQQGGSTKLRPQVYASLLDESLRFRRCACTRTSPRSRRIPLLSSALTSSVRLPTDHRKVRW